MISTAYQTAQLDQGNFTPESVSVADMFAGGLIPGLVLVGLYILYQLLVAWLRPDSSPAIPQAEIAGTDDFSARVLNALVPPVALIVAVLGSILAGIATPTEAAAVAAAGSLLLAGRQIEGRADEPSRLAPSA